MTMRTVIDNTNRKATTTDLEIIGMRLGILCAQRILRGYGTDPADPDPSALHVLSFFGQIENEYVSHQRATNGWLYRLCRQAAGALVVCFFIVAIRLPPLWAR